MAGIGTNNLGGKGYTPKGFVDLVKNFFAEKPRDVNGLQNRSAMYWWRKLFRWTMKIFYVDDWPKEWDSNYFWECMFQTGYICVTDTSLGVLPLRCGYHGVNVFEHPTDVTIGNPVLGTLQRVIGEDCVLMKLQYDYTGIIEMIDRYAYFFAAIDSAMAVNLINTKTAWIAEAEDKAQSATLERLYDDITMGKPGIVMKKNNGDGVKFQIMDVHNTFITDKLQMSQRMFLNMYLTDLGIPNFNSEKAARLNSEEVHGNDVEVYLTIQDWVDNIEEGFQQVNDMFGYNLKLRIRSREELMREIDAATKPTDTGADTGETEDVQSQ